MVDIQKLAHLSRIEVTDEEVASYEGEIESVLHYVERVQNAALDEVPDRDEGDVYNVMRSDDEPHEGGVYTQDLLDEAPERKDDYVQVKKIL